ncbi:MAG: S9 family peptidase [Crocinitomicaceae bacterium]|nr:S9 family peptidase [Crocinitomicaceae bacterium]
MKSIKISLFPLLLLFISFSSSAQEKELDNELIWSSREFSPEYVYSVRSMNDGEHFSALEDNKIVKYQYTDFENPIETIYDGADLKGVSIDDYFFNADETKLLVATHLKKIYRRSFTAKYYVVDLKSNKSEELFDKDPKEMLAEFSPDGSKVAFVYENNLYYKNLSNGEVIQVTNDGSKNGVINGSTDWVYEEEFSLTKAFYWSPKGTKIAYLKFDESDVKEFTMKYYRDDIYPEYYTFKYPKAGEDNSALSLHIYNLADEKTLEVDKGPFEYCPRLKWTNDDNKLVYLVLNRHQNHLIYATAEWQDDKIKGAIIHQDQSEQYVEIDDNLIFLNDGASFLRTSEKDGFNHIYKIGFDGSETQITSGNWDVVELKGVNEEKGIVYYTSVEEGAIYRGLYSIGLDGTKKKKLSERMGSNDADFSTGMKYYINYYSNGNEPPRISVHNAKGKEIDVLVDNEKLKEKLASYNFSKKEFITIKGEEHDLNAFIIKPPNFDETKKYPVYFNIYNGPGHNTVVDSWGGANFIYHQLLAQKGYIVISVDTRGTMYRGAKFKKSTYLQLGKLETEDMIAVAKEVQKWDYVDPERIGVMGWSYGGYMTSLCMTKGADVFKMGIAVAPVTNWKWYDNIYTERFMRTPKENNDGYEDNSPINHVEKMKGKYLIVHGSADDNVHVQNTMEMVNALVKHNKDFEMFIYTNKNHGIYGGFTRLHLFNKMLNFTLENL